MRIGCVISDSKHLVWIEGCTFDYLEIKGDFLFHLYKNGNLKSLLELGYISLEVMTSPLPREFGARIVGNDADHTYALKVFTQMVDLAAKIGIQKIVLGSGQARNVPKYFKKNCAYGQFIDFTNKAKHLCIDRNQILTIEPLHSGETNLINSCVEAQKIVNAVPGVLITADCYHIFTEQLSINDELYTSNIAHAHTSYLPRGSGVFQEEYQRSFLKKLQTLGCNSISIEERFNSKESMSEVLFKLRTLSNSISQSLDN